MITMSWRGAVGDETPHAETAKEAIAITTRER
jgi:hypothetical protein